MFKGLITVLLLAVCGCAANRPVAVEAKKPVSAVIPEKISASVPEQVQVGVTRPAAKGELKVAEAVLCRKVVDRVPQGVSMKFDKDVGRVCFFTSVTGAARPTKIEHLWFYEGEEKARVVLKVNSERWRTHSSVKIDPSRAGKWSVKALDVEGNELASADFEIE